MHDTLVAGARKPLALPSSTEGQDKLVAGVPTPLDLRGRSRTVTVTYWDRTNKFCQLFNAFDLTDVSGMKRTAEYRRRVLATKR